MTAPATGPTPNSMPGAGPAAGEGAENTNPEGETSENDDDGGAELTVEELIAERDRWKTQAKRNEGRAKSNAEKAKLLDGEGAQWKAAWEREQAAKNATKTPEQLKAEADAQAQRLVDEANAARAESEAKLLRWQLADGKVPSWAMGLVTAQTEEEITEQIATLTKDLAEYVAAQLPNNDPRRPAPNPLAGRTTQVGSGPREAFADAFGKLFN